LLVNNEQPFYSIFTSDAPVEVAVLRDPPWVSKWIKTWIWAFISVFAAIAGWLLQAVLVQREGYQNMLFVVYFRNVIGYTWLLAIGLLWQQYQPENLEYYNSRTWSYWKYKNLLIAPLSLLAFAAGYTWYLSIPLTNLSINTVVYNCNSPIVFLLSLLVFREGTTCSKAMSVGLCAIGVILVTLGPIGQGQLFNSTKEAMGIGLVLLSMLFFACYAVLMKWIEMSRSVPTGPRPRDAHLVAATDSMSVLGLLGFWNLILIPPVLAIAHVLGWETFVLPSTLGSWYLLFINAGLNTLFNVGLLIGIAFATPFATTLGLVLSIPISVLLDFLLNNYLMGIQGLIGASCVVIGFVCMTYIEYYRPNKEMV